MIVDPPRRVLVVSVHDMPSGGSIDRLLSGGCKHRDVPELGRDAKLTFGCESNPLAEVHVAAGPRVITLRWNPGGPEPGEAEQAALIELGRYARSVETSR